MNRKSRIQSLGRDSLQSRSSLAGGSASKLPRSTPLHKVPSTVFSAQKTPKRSSYFGASDHHLMKDVRPLNDKGYMKKCVIDLLAFLSDMNYPHPLSPKMLSPPTNKEYFRIMEFVYSILSPNYKMIARPDEEAAKLLFDLSYPFSLSKSTLSNIGTMSAWPHALGALTWLVDLVKYCMAVERNEINQILYNGVKKQEVFLDYLKDTYTAFMHGQNEPYTEINEHLENQIEDMNKDQLAEVEDLKVKAKQYRTRRDELLAEKEETIENEKLLFSLQKDRKNYQEYFEQFGDYCTSLQNKYDTLEAKHAELQEKALAMELSNKEIQSTITGQGLSVADVQELQIKNEQMENNIKTTEGRCKQLEAQFWEKQIGRSKLIDKIDTQIVEYTELCRELQLIPETAANANGIDFSLRTDHAEIDQNVEKLLTIIRPKLMAMKGEYLTSHGKLQQERNHNSTRIEQLQEQILDQKKIKTGLQEQFTKMKEEEEKQIMEAESLELAQNEELEGMKEQIQSLKTINSLSMDDVTLQLKIEKEKVKEAELKSSKEKNEYVDFLVQLSRNCLEQKEKIRRKFEEFNKYIDAINKAYLPQLKEIGQGMKEVEIQKELYKKQIDDLKKDC